MSFENPRDVSNAVSVNMHRDDITKMRRIIAIPKRAPRDGG